MNSETSAIVERLRAVNRAEPVIDRLRVEAAFAAHLNALGVAARPVRWFADMTEAHLYVCRAARSSAWGAAWSVAWGAARSAAWSAAESSAWSSAWGAAWSVAWGAAESVAWSAAESSAESSAWGAARSAARSAAWGAAESSAWGAAWSAARSAARSAAWGAVPNATEPVKRMCALWLPFADAFEAGLWIFWVLDAEVVAVPRPAIHAQGDRLHCETGPAVEWPGGSRFFFWRGVQVPEHVVMRPETIAVSEIKDEPNAEARRVMVERYGAPRYLRDAGAELLNEDRFGKLWRIEQSDDEPIVMVELRNSTPEPDGSVKDYWLRVEPSLRPLLPDGSMGKPQRLTAHNAVASTFGKRGPEYEPVVET